MSLYLDQKYLTLISNRLPLFKKKKDNTYNCRCIICGDSAKKTTKARGYFFPNKNKLFYKCFNCDVAMAFSSFLKQLDQTLFQEYSFEDYSEGMYLSNSKPDYKFEQPVFKSSSKYQKIINNILVTLDKLPSDHEAIKYVEKRQIPKEKYKKIFFIEHVCDIAELNDKYRASIKSKEPRLVFPFYDENKSLTGVSCRAIRGEALRYITVKIHDDQPLIYGLEDVDTTKPVYVVEGPIDSLFLDNCIAVAGLSMNKLNNIGVPKDKLIIVHDNQSRNIEVCKVIQKTIDNDYKCVIWPDYIEQKDINEMISYNINVHRVIKENTFSGLSAVVEFTRWRKN